MPNRFAEKAKVLAETCPLCKAAPGEICRSVRMPGAPGLRRNRMHDSRVALIVARTPPTTPCPRCGSDQHVRCCVRCGAPVLWIGRQFCSRACRLAQEDEDRAANQERSRLNALARDTMDHEAAREQYVQRIAAMNKRQRRRG